MCEFTNNTSINGFGGAVSLDGANWAKFFRNTFTNNTARRGGSIHFTCPI
jgi:predicted outer membrane repeat protein